MVKENRGENKKKMSGANSHTLPFVFRHSTDTPEPEISMRTNNVSKFEITRPKRIVRYRVYGQVSL